MNGAQSTSANPKIVEAVARAGGWWLLGLVFNDYGFDDVTHLFVLGFEVGGEGVLRYDFGGETLDDANAGGFEGGDFLRVVGDEADLGDTEGLEGLGGKLVGTAVGGKAELDVGFDGVAALILQFICAEFGHETNATALLLLVEEDSRAFGSDALKG